MNRVQAILLRVGLAGCGVACMAPGCNGDVLADSTFRLWCGDTLCDWQLDAGHVKQAATWHPDDYGVELVDAPTQISQKTTEGSSCMEFSAIADVEASAQAKIQVDFNFDDVVDFEAPIPESHWAKTSTLIHAPEHYGDTLRFIVRKEGTGRAVLAEIRLQRVTTCTGAAPTLRNVPIGEQCASPSECDSGVCCNGICAPCCSPSPNTCKAGVACAPPKVNFPNPLTGAPPALPMLCAPGESQGAAGDACINANDCASGTCTGATPVSACYGDAGCAVVKVRAGTCR